MYYTADPVRDALRYESHMEAASEAREASEVMYSEMISEAFTVDLPKVSNVKLLQVPYVANANNGCIRYQPITEAVSDLIADDIVFDMFLEVLRKSNCEMVSRLRAVMAHSYSDKWASELSEYAE